MHRTWVDQPPAIAEPVGIVSRDMESRLALVLQHRHRVVAPFGEQVDRLGAEQRRVEAIETHRAAAAHKTRFTEYFARLLREAGLGEEHATDLMQLFDGAVVTAVREGTNAPALRAKRIAAMLLGVPESGKSLRQARRTNATAKATGKASSESRAKRVASAKAAAASMRARARSVVR